MLENPDIVKVFHDLCEDTSALLRQYNLKCEGVFDTQVAHRLISNAGVLESSKDEHKNNNISLNGLLATYLGRQNVRKDSIAFKMAEDAAFWEKVRLH